MKEVSIECSAIKLQWSVKPHNESNFQYSSVRYGTVRYRRHRYDRLYYVIYSLYGFGDLLQSLKEIKCILVGYGRPGSRILQCMSPAQVLQYDHTFLKICKFIHQIL